MTRDRAIDFQKANKIDAFFETSAKTGNNVEEVFALAAKQLYSIHKRDTVCKNAYRFRTQPRLLRTPPERNRRNSPWRIIVLQTEPRRRKSDANLQIYVLQKLFHFGAFNGFAKVEWGDS